MAWIDTPHPARGPEELKQAVERVVAARGRLSNILRVHSCRPRAMTAHLGLYRELMFAQSELSREEREAVAVAVSAVNGCHY